MRQAIGADLAQDDAPFGQHLVGLCGSLALGLREMDEDKIGCARRDLEPEFADFRGQPGPPFLVMGDRALDMCVIRNRRNAGGARGRVYVERTANAVDRIDHMGRTVHPAEPQRRKTVHLREGAAHHDIF